MERRMSFCAEGAQRVEAHDEGHRLGGSGGTVGFPGASRLAALLEEGAAPSSESLGDLASAVGPELEGGDGRDEPGR